MNASCEICGVEIEVQMCCDGRECGCMGQPTEPPVCEKNDCMKEYINRRMPTKEEEDAMVDHFLENEYQPPDIGKMSEAADFIQKNGIGTNLDSIY